MREPGIEALGRIISTQALHDSPERYPLQCHPGTRKRVLESILRWIDADPSPSCRVFWLYGRPGVGKSAILKTITDELAATRPGTSRRRLAGSFFFRRGLSSCENAIHLFPTLAYQMALNVPGMRSAINQAMVFDVTIPSKALEVQISKLIIEPFQRVCGARQSENSTLPPASIVIIDGLDECAESCHQKAILTAITAMFVNHPDIPVRFLIASRYEHHLRSAFDRPPLRDVTQRIYLDDSFPVHEDIRLFFEDKFAEIYNENLDIMKSSARLPWPGRMTIDMLTARAAGQFIYAVTVVRFVGAEGCHPCKQLDNVLASSKATATRRADVGFSALDNLYMHILSAHPNQTLIRDILQLVRNMKCFYISPRSIAALLEIDESAISLAIRSLSSLLAIYPTISEESNEKTTRFAALYGRTDKGIGFIHRSLTDFLEDASRSRRFHIFRSDSHVPTLLRNLALRCLRSMTTRDAPW
ncbi:unnamed protein product [Cyclocybe aegerita]|uniref:Nephrocystin 3-like N-terminal domain-containing protein n=1 Tax=Cyclocybe aegerita TaxID=1973307 RepID=A0A8S0W773_CYCAE|nr:unnamed protein product [Cyclocybe aegerita]